jgi:hypothetical protein
MIMAHPQVKTSYNKLTDAETKRELKRLQMTLDPEYRPQVTKFAASPSFTDYKYFFAAP